MVVAVNVAGIKKELNATNTAAIKGRPTTIRERLSRTFRNSRRPIPFVSGCVVGAPRAEPFGATDASEPVSFSSGTVKPRNDKGTTT